MNTALKIIRTITGLPIVVVAWPFWLACMSFWFVAAHLIFLFRWLVVGEYGLCEKDDAECFNNGILFALKLPYIFIKKVWK